MADKSSEFYEHCQFIRIVLKPKIVLCFDVASPSKSSAAILTYLVALLVIYVLSKTGRKVVIYDHDCGAYNLLEMYKQI